MTRDDPKIWKQLALVTNGESTLVVAYALPAFDLELDIDREADLRTLAIHMAMSRLSRPTDEEWLDQPLVCADAAMPALLFSQRFVWPGLHAIN